MQRLAGLVVVYFWAVASVNASKPEPEYWVRPDSLGLTYFEKKLITPDKAQLLSWILPTPSVRPLHKTLVIAYAGTGNMANCVHYAAGFLKAGFDVLLFDYRGFGHSSPFPVEPNRLYYNEFTPDLTTAVRAAKRQFPKNKTGVLSFSMSTILATLSNQQEPIDFLIGEGYVKNFQAIIDFWHKKNGKVITLPPESDRYAEATRQLRCPVLLIAGTADLLTPVSWARSVVAQQPNRKLLTYEGDHLQATQVWQEKEFADGYVRRIKNFVLHS